MNLPTIALHSALVITKQLHQLGIGHFGRNQRHKHHAAQTNLKSALTIENEMYTQLKALSGWCDTACSAGDSQRSI